VGGRSVALLCDFDGSEGGWLTARPGRFTPGNDPVPVVQEAGETQGRSGRVRNTSPLPGFDHQNALPVATRCVD
jgi:hypothetical protein